MGNVLEVSIAVALDIVHFNNILHFEIKGDDDMDETVSKLILIASALKTCASELEKEYKSLESPEKEVPAAESKWYLPCVTLREPTKVPFELDFKSKLSRSNTSIPKMKYDQARVLSYARSLFLADLRRNGSQTPDLEVVVKLTTIYNRDAHEMLASVGCTDAGETTGGDSNVGDAHNGSARALAPKLHGCYSFMGGGNLKMVVMDRVNGKPLSDYGDHSLPSSVFDDVKKAIDLLHQKGYVFGDLRAPNVMVSDDGTHAMLIDFDWVGEEGKGRYPPTINKNLANKELKHDVRRLGPMHKAQDQWAFDRLRNKYCMFHESL